MPTSTLIIYEPIENFGDNTDYWREYAEFYEKYWGGPTSPSGVWFGSEYQAYRKALSSNMDLEEEEIVDCFFMKDGDQNYYISPFNNKGKSYILAAENIIPLEWFVIFSRDERKTLYTHWGFNAIHYCARTIDAIDRINESIAIIDSRIDIKNSELNTTDYYEFINLRDHVKHLYNNLIGFDTSGFIVLNYGELCSVIHPYTLENEDSVGEVNSSINFVKEGSFTEAARLLKILKVKWDEIREKASGGQIPPSYDS